MAGGESSIVIVVILRVCITADGAECEAANWRSEKRIQFEKSKSSSANLWFLRSSALILQSLILDCSTLTYSPTPQPTPSASSSPSPKWPHSTSPCSLPHTSQSHYHKRSSFLPCPPSPSRYSPARLEQRSRFPHRRTALTCKRRASCTLVIRGWCSSLRRRRPASRELSKASRCPILTFRTDDSSNLSSQLRIMKLSVFRQTAEDYRCVSSSSLSSLATAELSLTSAESSQGPHICRFSFREAGGYQFYETVEEMKNRLGASGRGTPVEALRSPFSSPLPPPSLADHCLSTALYTPSTSTSSAPADPSPLGTSTSPPNEDDLAAAAVARSAQEEEEDAVMAASTGDVRPPSVGPGGAQAARSAEGEPRDGPPGYEP